MKCARCESPMKSLQQSCNNCGWTRGTNPSSTDSAPRQLSRTWGDGFCDWHTDGRRCQQQAVWLQDNRRWCYWHRANASAEVNHQMTRDLAVYGVPEVPGTGLVLDPAPPPENLNLPRLPPERERIPGSDDDREVAV